MALVVVAAIGTGWGAGSLSTSAAVPAPWELRVCADPYAYPASSRENPGYDNVIAEILASDLGAEVEFVWVPSVSSTVTNVLNTGGCDVMFGTADGASGMLSSVPYLRTPYVFVQRTDRGLDIRSLDDPLLAELTIATYHDGAPRRALTALGHVDNVHVPDPLPTVGAGPDFATPALDAVANGTVDLALLYGPDAARYGKEHPGLLTMNPVEPEIVPPSLQMFRIVTIGVRSGDEALRDALNLSLARRWDEVQATLERFAIPRQPIPQPLAPAQPSHLIRVGAVLPLANGNPNPYDVMAAAARTGARLAEDLPRIVLDGQEFALDVVFAHAPNADTARRAAQRLVATDHVVALLGGFDAASAKALGEVARDSNVLFMNIAATDLQLRRPVDLPTTFHVEAPSSRYITAAVEDLRRRGAKRVAVVYEGSERGVAWRGIALAGLAHAGLTTVVEQAVPPGQFAFPAAVRAVASADVDAVLSLLEPSEQEFFLNQLDRTSPELVVGLLAEPAMQTRGLYFRLAQAAPSSGTQPRPALWDAGLNEGAALAFNERFSGRSGHPADPTGWAAYVASALVFDAVQASASTAVSDLMQSLLDVNVGEQRRTVPGLIFRPCDHQLQLPLYLVELDPEAAWGAEVSTQIAVARVVTVLEPAALEGESAVGASNPTCDGFSTP